MTYTFGPFEIDEARWQVRGPAGPIAFEPRAFAVLLFLIRNRDRVVSKEELIEGVWDGEHVSDSAVAQAVTRARRALEDKGSERRLIQTVHGRGYRFVAPIRSRSETTGGRQGLRRSMAIIIGVVLLAAAVAAAAMLAARREAVPDPRLAAIEVDVRAEPGDAEAPLLALSFREALSASLHDLERVRAVSADTARPPAAEATHRVSVVLKPGEIPGHATLEASLRELPVTDRRPTQLGRHQIPYLRASSDIQRFLAVRQAVIRGIAADLERTVRASHGTMPGELEAWKLYLEAKSDWQVGCEDAATAQRLERALEIDPTFAPAWYMLAGARFTEASLCSARPGTVAAAFDAVEHAKRLAPAWPEPHQLEAALRLHTGGTAEAFGLLFAAYRRWPESLVVQVRLAEALRYAGQLERSQGLFDAALGRYPASSLLFDWVAYPYLYRGEWQRFLDLLSGRGSPFFRYYRGFAELMSGDREGAIATLEPAFTEHPEDLFARLSQALLANVQDRPIEARVVLEQLMRQRAHQEVRDGEVTYKIAQLLVFSGALEAGLEQLSLAVEEGFFCTDCMTHDPLLRAASSEAAFKAAQSKARERQLRFSKRFAADLRQLAAQGSP